MSLNAPALVGFGLHAIGFFPVLLAFSDCILLLFPSIFIFIFLLVLCPVSIGLLCV
jgi:hypothetical protein